MCTGIYYVSVTCNVFIIRTNSAISNKENVMCTHMYYTYVFTTINNNQKTDFAFNKKCWGKVNNQSETCSLVLSDLSYFWCVPAVLLSDLCNFVWMKQTFFELLIFWFVIYYNFSRFSVWWSVPLMIKSDQSSVFCASTKLL